ncbi:MAG TPA: hypothetical protein PL033_20050 [Candidatus Brocadiia bacterium]|nr:hypothetical protein [Candidatus Brocadiia bacterium]
MDGSLVSLPVRIRSPEAQYPVVSGVNAGGASAGVACTGRVSSVIVSTGRVPAIAVYAVLAFPVAQVGEVSGWDVQAWRFLIWENPAGGCPTGKVVFGGVPRWILNLRQPAAHRRLKCLQRIKRLPRAGIRMVLSGVRPDIGDGVRACARFAGILNAQRQAQLRAVILRHIPFSKAEIDQQCLALLVSPSRVGSIAFRIFRLPVRSGG